MLKLINFVVSVVLMGSLAYECQIGFFIEEDKTARQRLIASPQRGGYLGRREPVVQPAAKDQWSGGRFRL